MKSYKYYLLLVLASMSFGPLFAQKSTQVEIRGMVTESQSGETIPFANLVLFTQGEKKACAGAATDFDGLYSIIIEASGYYSLHCTFTGLRKVIVDSLLLEPGKIYQQNFTLDEETEMLEEVVMHFKMPLISPSKTSKITTAEDIQSMAVRDISSVASQAAGVTQGANGSINVRGSRGEGTVYFIDGVKMRGSVNVPQSRENGEVLEREEYADVPPNQFLSAELNPLSTFSSDVDVASYANIRRYLTDGYLPPAEAVRIEEMINYFSYQAQEIKGEESFAEKHQLVTCPWEEKHQLLRISINTEKIDQENLPPSNLVFLIDVSGSMNSEDKLPLLQKSLRLLVNNLRAEDHVSMVVYASNTGVVLEPTRGDEKERIIQAINSLRAGGSTAGGAGIELAYKLAEENFKKGHNNRVILATDGDFNVGVSSESALKKLIEKKRETGIFLSVLGFGTGNYMDAKMEALADNGNGNYAYIDNILEAKKVLVEEMGANLHVVAKDTKFQIEFNPAVVEAYRLIGYENRILAAEDFNNDAKDAGDIGAGHYVTALYEIVPRNLATQSPVDVDALKYRTKVEINPAFADELATLKIRHKKPDEDKSSLEEKVIANRVESLNPDLSFMAAVASFGMLLRESEFSGTADYSQVIAWAKEGLKAKNIDYRSEFINLVELAQELKKAS
jgi:Ca-activated chloride channel family protein